MNPPAHPHVERVVLIFWFACTSEFMVMVNYWAAQLARKYRAPLSTLFIPLRQCWRAPTGHRPARDLLLKVIQPRVEYRVRCAMGF